MKISEDSDDPDTLICPECGGEMSFQGYRPLFPVCTECGESFHVDRCK